MVDKQQSALEGLGGSGPQALDLPYAGGSGSGGVAAY
jgi:hypothetical protein